MLVVRLQKYLVLYRFIFFVHFDPSVDIILLEIYGLIHGILVVLGYPSLWDVSCFWFGLIATYKETNKSILQQNIVSLLMAYAVVSPHKTVSKWHLMEGNHFFIQTCNTENTECCEQFRCDTAEMTALENEKHLDLKQSLY